MLMEISEDSGDDMQLIEEDVGDICEENDELPAQLLKLKISDSFQNSIRLMLAWNRSFQSKYNDRSKYEGLKSAQNQLVSVKKGKRIPTELPLLTLSIGNKKFIRTHECYIFAKFCYGTKKVVCQMRKEKLSRKVDIPFADITSLLVCFDHREFDTLRIEAKSLFKSFSADKPWPGKFLDWKVDDSKEDSCFPESRSIFLEVEKGMLEKAFAKLLCSDPRLERVVKIARGNFDDQHLYQGLVLSHTQQANTFAFHSLPSNIVSPYIGW